jgi:hypothetical protein
VAQLVASHRFPSLAWDGRNGWPALDAFGML